MNVSISDCLKLQFCTQHCEFFSLEKNGKLKKQETKYFTKVVVKNFRVN